MMVSFGQASGSRKFYNADSVLETREAALKVVLKHVGVLGTSEAALDTFPKTVPLKQAKQH